MNVRIDNNTTAHLSNELTSWNKILYIISNGIQFFIFNKRKSKWEKRIFFVVIVVVQHHLLSGELYLQVKNRFNFILQLYVWIMNAWTIRPGKVFKVNISVQSLKGFTYQNWIIINMIF